MNAELDQLYQVPLKDFVKERNALAAERKKAGDAEGSKSIKALTKPSASAWAVNQIFWKEREVFDALIVSGDGYRAALTNDGAAAADAADTERKQKLDNALRSARRILEEDGQNATPVLLGRIATTLDAISSYGSANPEPVAGRLTADIDPPGFGAFAGLVPKPPEPRAAASSEAAPESADVTPDPALEREADKAEAIHKAREEFAAFSASVHELDVEVSRLRATLHAKEAELTKATERLDQMQLRLKQMES